MKKQQKDLDKKAILIITEELIQVIADQVFGKKLTTKQVESLRYECLWDKDSSLYPIYRGITEAIFHITINIRNNNDIVR